jgi:hypothetical protein
VSASVKVVSASCRVAGAGVTAFLQIHMCEEEMLIYLNAILFLCMSRELAYGIPRMVDVISFYAFCVISYSAVWRESMGNAI